MHCACVHKCVHTRSLQLCPTLCITMTIALQAPLSMEFSKQNYWSGLPCPPAGDLPDPVVVDAQLCPTLCNPMDCSTAGFPVLNHLSELVIELVMPSNHLILCRLLFLLPSVFASIRVFSRPCSGS